MLEVFQPIAELDFSDGDHAPLTDGAPPNVGKYKRDFYGGEKTAS